jgi:membrane-associated phospholipid phosphatase
VPRSLLGAALGVAFGFELAALGASVLPRPAPIVAVLDLPIDAEWQMVWQGGGSFPNRHTLLAASLAVSALIAWAPLGLASSVLAVAGGATSVYFGVAYATDVLAALVLGAASAVAGDLGAGLILFGRLR